MTKRHMELRLATHVWHPSIRFLMVRRRLSAPLCLVYAILKTKHNARYTVSLLVPLSLLRRGLDLEQEELGCILKSFSFIVTHFYFLRSIVRCA